MSDPTRPRGAVLDLLRALHTVEDGRTWLARSGRGRMVVVADVGPTQCAVHRCNDATVSEAQLRGLVDVIPFGPDDPPVEYVGRRRGSRERQADVSIRLTEFGRVEAATP